MGEGAGVAQLVDFGTHFLVASSHLVVSASQASIPQASVLGVHSPLINVVISAHTPTFVAMSCVHPKGAHPQSEKYSVMSFFKVYGRKKNNVCGGVEFRVGYISSDVLAAFRSWSFLLFLPLSSATSRGAHVSEG